MAETSPGSGDAGSGDAGSGDPGSGDAGSGDAAVTGTVVTAAAITGARVTGARVTDAGVTDAGVSDAAVPGAAPETPRRRRWVRRCALALAAVVTCLAVLLAAGWVALVAEDSGTPGAAARSTGQDAEWLGHAWVDGRKSQSDVDRLAASLRGTGIHDLFVHTGPFRDDGTLDPGLRRKARWVIGALHAALPGVRVQAWLGAHPVPGQLDLHSRTTRANILTATGQVLDDGYDGVHYDFEPVDSGDLDLLDLLGAAHRLTGQRHAILSLSASMLAPLPGLGTAVAAMPGRKGVWSAGYLRRLAGNVDQVAVMAYDTGLWTASLYGGFVRRLTALALDAVPAGVALFIGVPAYHYDSLGHHHAAETMAAALHGVRLAFGAHPSRSNFGVAVYVDFTATAADWSTYRRDWVGEAG